MTKKSIPPLTALIHLMQSINGIGPIQAPILAREILQVMGHKAAIHLTETTLRDKLQEPRFFDLLSISAQIDVMYNPLREIPRRLLDLVQADLTKYVQPVGLVMDIGGGYRRGKAISHDVDLLLQVARGAGPTTLEKVRHLVNTEKNAHIFIQPPFELGGDKASLLIEFRPTKKQANEANKKYACIIKADVYFAPADEYLYALLFLTGSGPFNIHMRAVAKHRGYLLNQRGLFHRESGDRIYVANERELFDLLHMTWREPAERIR